MSRAATCTDASSNKDICGLAIDGGLMPYNNAWMSANEGVGSFITIKFVGEYFLIGGKIMQRLSKTGQNQNLILTFSDGSIQEVLFNFVHSYITKKSYNLSICTQDGTLTE